VVLEEKGEAADFDARRKAEREVRWAVAEEDAFEEEKSNLHHTKQSPEDFTVFAAPSPPTVSRHSADARPVRGLAKADASALATAAALRAKRLRHKKHVQTPPSAKWDFGVGPVLQVRSFLEAAPVSLRQARRGAVSGPARR
jgi:hypothetical protein